MTSSIAQCSIRQFEGFLVQVLGTAAVKIAVVPEFGGKDYWQLAVMSFAETNWRSFLLSSEFAAGRMSWRHCCRKFPVRRRVCVRVFWVACFLATRRSLSVSRGVLIAIGPFFVGDAFLSPWDEQGGEQQGEARQIAT